MNAESILKSKGYDSTEIIDILQANENNLDLQVREKYGLGEEPLHLWEEYAIGDADEDTVQAAAEEHGFDGIDDLLAEMDSDLVELAESYPRKKMPDVTVSYNEIEKHFEISEKIETEFDPEFSSIKICDMGEDWSLYIYNENGEMIHEEEMTLEEEQDTLREIIKLLA